MDKSMVSATRMVLSQKKKSLTLRRLRSVVTGKSQND